MDLTRVKYTGLRFRVYGLGSLFHGFGVSRSPSLNFPSNRCEQVSHRLPGRQTAFEAVARDAASGFQGLGLRLGDQGFAMI